MNRVERRRTSLSRLRGVERKVESVGRSLDRVTRSLGMKRRAELVHHSEGKMMQVGEVERKVQRNELPMWERLRVEGEGLPVLEYQSEWSSMRRGG